MMCENCYSEIIEDEMTIKCDKCECKDIEKYVESLKHAKILKEENEKLRACVEFYAEANREILMSGERARRTLMEIDLKL